MKSWVCTARKPLPALYRQADVPSHWHKHAVSKLEKPSLLLTCTTIFCSECTGEMKDPFTRRSHMTCVMDTVIAIICLDFWFLECVLQLELHLRANRPLDKRSRIVSNGQCSHTSPCQYQCDHSIWQENSMLVHLTRFCLSQM